MDIRIGGADPTLSPTGADRRRGGPEVREEPPLPPSAIVELGRTPESTGLYTARGTMEGTTASTRTVELPTGAEAPSARELPRPDAPGNISSFGGPEGLLVPSNAQVGALVAGSPEVAVAVRTRLPLEAMDPQHPAATMLAGIQPLVASAVRQAEKGNAAAEHEDEIDPTREDKDAPLTDSGKAVQARR
jgi:hypothetical protein